MFFSTPTTNTSVSTLLHVLAVIASIPFIAAQNVTTDDLYAKISLTAALPGFNVDGDSVFTNFVNAVNNRQFFHLIIGTGGLVHEKPESEPAQLTFLHWCSDLTFSDLSNSSLMGYAARCVEMLLTGYADVIAAGGQLPFEYSEGKFVRTLSISAVYVEQLNVFEGQFHSNTGDWVARYWDDGRKTMPMIAWEGHDEGDMSPNAATSSFSSFRDLTWISVEEVAQLFNTSVDEFTSETFKQVYEDAWIKGHEKEAAEKNPNPGPELETIEQVKNENKTNFIAGETTTQPDTEDASDDGDSGSTRKLTSIAARFVSAALRVFGTTVVKFLERSTIDRSCLCLYGRYKAALADLIRM